MAFATLYAYLFLPYVPPPKADVVSEKRQGLSRFLGPAKMLAPQRWRLPDGRITRQFGVPLLFAGIFTGVLATGYIPTLIQMFSTIKFGFGTKENGVLMSYYCVIRGTFLTFAFPHIIDHGRKWFATSTFFNPAARSPSSSAAAAAEAPAATLQPPPTSRRARRVSAAEDMEAAVSLGLEDASEPSAAALDPAPISGPADGQASTGHENSAFDLFFLKWSLVADGLLTGLATFCSASWHVFAVATLLPLASGSASAAKSVMIEMCPAGQKADALGAISLVEMVAALSTCEYFSLLSPPFFWARFGGGMSAGWAARLLFTMPSFLQVNVPVLTFLLTRIVSVFGLVFSELAEVGKPNLVFLCNAAVAVFASIMLIGCRFPPEGSERVHGDDDDNDDSESDSGNSEGSSQGVERVVERVPTNGK